VIQKLYILSQAYHNCGYHLSPYHATTILLTVILMLYLLFPWLVHSVTGSLHLPFPFTHFAHPLTLLLFGDFLGQFVCLFFALLFHRGQYVFHNSEVMSLWRSGGRGGLVSKVWIFFFFITTGIPYVLFKRKSPFLVKVWKSLVMQFHSLLHA